MLNPENELPINASILGAGLLVICTLAAGLLAFHQITSVQAAPARQIPIFTPTPLPDGRIIYIVKANDTLLSISLLTGVPVEELRELNKLSGDTIIEGQQLLLGLAGPPEEIAATTGPLPTATAVLPTATPKPGSGKLCILLFNDLNGDSIRQEEEPSIPDGAISVSNRSGSVSLTANTVTGMEPNCFDTVPEGDYNISVAIPGGFNPTTSNNYALNLKAGDQAFLDFGAQANSQTLADSPVPTGSGKDPLLGIVGGFLLLVGVGLAIFAGRLLRSKE